MKINLPIKVNSIIATLQAHGFEAYAVGGCVRDSVLGREPEDWDIATSATPEVTKSLFAKTFDTGIEHGTVTVLMGKEGFEVTTYRIDGEYEDSRHPKNVAFTRNLKDDLLRRDFTINAMAYNESSGLVDIFGGTEDLNAGIIRCVGDAVARFGEDALRILRAVRFAAQLGFQIEEETGNAIKKLSSALANISAERIQAELVKILVSPNPERILDAYEFGITKVILPEFDAMMQTEQETPHHMYNVGVHTVKSMMSIRPDKILRLTMLLHDVGKPLMKTMDHQGTAHFKCHDIKGEEMAKAILRRLKFDNDTTKKVVKLVLYHDYRMPAKPKNVRKAINKIGEELFPYYIEVRRADALAQSEFQRESKLQVIDDIENCWLEIKKRGECVSLKELDVKGSDLIAAGMKPGKEIGDALKLMLEMVIEEPDQNQKEKLLIWVKKNCL